MKIAEQALKFYTDHSFWQLYMWQWAADLQNPKTITIKMNCGGKLIVIELVIGDN